MSAHPSDLSILLQPGIGNSGSAHWQSLWEASEPHCARVPQREWDNPVCSEWVQTLATAAQQLRQEGVIVAHSLGCLAVAHWLAGGQATPHNRVRALMLVAPPDPNGPAFPPQATGFSPLPVQPLRLPTLVVASENDPYSSMEFARFISDAWGARLVNIGAAGHINAASGLGAWPRGLALLRELIANG